MELPLVDIAADNPALECFDPDVDATEQTTTKPHVYVPPRLDQDRYQSDIPDMLEEAGK
jgi:hypothetical protein